MKNYLCLHIALMFEEMLQSDFMLYKWVIRVQTWNWDPGGAGDILDNKELYCTKIEIIVSEQEDIESLVEEMLTSKVYVHLSFMITRNHFTFETVVK